MQLPESQNICEALLLASRALLIIITSYGTKSVAYPLQALADERARELSQAWQQLQELKATFRQQQLDLEEQTRAAQEATQVAHLPVPAHLGPARQGR